MEFTRQQTFKLEVVHYEYNLVDVPHSRHWESSCPCRTNCKTDQQTQHRLQARWLNPSLLDAPRSPREPQKGK